MSSVIVILLLLIVCEGFFQVYQNKKTVEAEEILRCDRIQEIIEESMNSFDSVTNTVYEHCLTLAKSVSLIIGDDKKVIYDQGSLGKIANSLNIDEINFFDEKGVIFAGTEEKFYGMSMTDGYQIGEFLPMLSDKEKSICQDIMPNSAAGTMMLYAAVWNETKDAIIQIGVRPVRVNEAIENGKISTLVKRITPKKGTIILVSDKNTGEILGSSNEEFTGMYISEFGISMVKPENKLFKTRYDYQSYYTIYRHAGDYDISILESIDTVNANVPIVLLIVFLYICVGSVVIFLITNHTNKVIVNVRNQENSQSNASVNRLKRQLAIVEGVSNDFSDIFVIDFAKNTARMIKINGQMITHNAPAGRARPYDITWKKYIDKFVYDADVSFMRKAVKQEVVEKQ